MPRALAELIARVRAEVLVLSFSDEGFVPLEDLVAMCGQRGRSVEVLAFDSARYNGARIGVFNASGQKVGRISHTRNSASFSPQAQLTFWQNKMEVENDHKRGSGQTASGRTQARRKDRPRLRRSRSEERRVGKECRSRWSPYH